MDSATLHNVLDLRVAFVNVAAEGESVVVCRALTSLMNCVPAGGNVAEL